MAENTHEACKGCPSSGCSVERTHSKLDQLAQEVHHYYEQIFGVVCRATPSCSHGDCNHRHYSVAHMEAHLKELDAHEKTCKDPACKNLHPKLRAAVAKFKHVHDICHNRAHKSLKASRSLVQISDAELESLFDD